MKYASDQLTGLIHAARRRRQLLILLRGVAIFLFLCAAIIFLTGWAANRYRYNDALCCRCEWQRYRFARGIYCRW